MRIENINVHKNLCNCGPAVEFEIDGLTEMEWLVKFNEYWACERRENESNLKMNYKGQYTVYEIHNFLDAALESLI